MNKRERCRRRQILRKTAAALALITALAVETVMMGAFARDVIRPALKQQVTIDAGACFAGR